MNATMLAPGTQLGRFELLSFLGRGGMGEVWRARDPRLGREVAVKVLREHVARDRERVARFEREARALAALNHPNVAQIYEVGEWAPSERSDGEEGTLHYLVMELVDGGSLAGRLVEGPILMGEGLRLLVQVGRAVEAAHARGVIHRDLKPANILLTRTGDAKVVDFGLARFFRRRDEVGDSDITQAMSSSGMVVGTASYMAPEQVRGEECDERCDVWALGCCLGEVLSGRRLFDGASVPEIVGKVMAGRPDIDGLPRETPRSVRVLLQRCVSRDRESRPTLREVMAVLESAAAGAAGPKAGAWRWAAGGAAAAALAAAALLLGRHEGAIRRKALPAGDLRVAVWVADSVRGDEERASALHVVERLLKAVSQSKGVQAVVRGEESVGVEVFSAGGGARGSVHLVAMDKTRGAIVAVIDEEIDPLRPDEAVERAGAALTVALQLEGIRRYLDAEDALHGFLVRRTASLEAARAFRDGVQYYSRLRASAAEEQFAAARRADEAFWPAYVYLAQLAGSSSRFREGRELLQRCRSLLREPEGAELAAVEVAEALLAEDLQRLLEALERARKWFPDSGELMYRAAWTYRSLDRPERAIPLLKELIDAEWQPDWSPTWEQLAMNQLLEGSVRAALATAAAGEERFPERFAYPFTAACALQILGERDEARAALERAIRKRLDFASTDPLVTHQTAQWWASLLRWPEEIDRQWRAVLAEADRRLASSPGDESLLLARAEALNSLGRSGEAVPILESFRADEAGEPYRLLALARGRAALGDAAGARAHLQQAAQIWRSRSAPALGRLAYNIGCAWCVVGDAEEALTWFLRARDQHGIDRLDLALDPELDLLRRQGLLERLARR